ncbi:MAG: IS30 family transposase [Gemmatimonadaceae bacterium]
MGARGFKQLTARDRALISKLKEQKLGISEIARRIGKSKSTVSRELRRNQSSVTPQEACFLFRIERLWTEEQLDEYLRTQPAEKRKVKTYWAHAEAQELSERRRWISNQKRRRKQPETRKWVIEKLREGWSPQQIAGRSKLEGLESVSHEYVYALLHRDKKRGGRLYRLLKRFGKRKQRLGDRDYGAPAPGRAGIEERPAIVEERSRLGDSEGDLIVGYRQSGYVLSVQDRKSRKAILRKLETKQMTRVREQLEVALRKLGGGHTLTVDNGKEFYDHQKLSKATRVKVYFTHPYSSTERGSIENLNGLVRYYLPKRTSFAKLTQRRLNQLEKLLNHRPRKCLGYLTPHEVHSKTQPLLRLKTERCI